MQVIGDLIKIVFDKKNRPVVTAILIALIMLTGLILFLPESILMKMSLDNLPDFWKIIIGLTFLFSTTMIATIVLLLIFKYIRLKILNKTMKIECKKKIERLNQTHKSLIAKALQNSNKSILLDISSGDTLYLLSNGFLFEPQQIPRVEPNNEIFKIFALQPWLIDLYNEEPELFRIKIRR